jgi:hypothetical protein
LQQKGIEIFCTLVESKLDSCWKIESVLSCFEVAVNNRRVVVCYGSLTLRLFYGHTVAIR